jgi:Zn-finger protein
MHIAIFVLLKRTRQWLMFRFVIIRWLFVFLHCWVRILRRGRAIYYEKRQGFARTPTHMIKNGLCSKRIRNKNRAFKTESLCPFKAKHWAHSLVCLPLYPLSDGDGAVMVTSSGASVFVQLSCIILHLTNFQLLILRSVFLRISPLAQSRQENDQHTCQLLALGGIGVIINNNVS